MSELTTLQKQLSSICELKYNEPMSNHTSFRIGGAAEVMAFPKNTDELADILKQADALGIKPRILGAGTNVLAPDEPLEGIVVCLKHLDGMEVLSSSRIGVMAGVTMTRAALFAAKNGLSGLEFAHGIPGTVGGGVFMNAGAYGGEISQVLESALVMQSDGKLYRLTQEQMEYTYRHSILEITEDIVVYAVFNLEKTREVLVKLKMQDLMEKRSKSQPLDLPSAGSAFKRPQGGYAAALIDEAGLKGYQVGGAAISTKHAGFAVNLGGATAQDVKTLLNDVSNIVYEKSGIRLEPEIRIW